MVALSYGGPSPHNNNREFLKSYLKSLQSFIDRQDIRSAKRLLLTPWEFGYWKWVGYSSTYYV